MVSTVTNYRSPVRLVKHALEETEAYSAQAISRARKKLMAEISLSGNEIVIDEVAYSRHDASSLLDAMTEESWKMHSVIYAHEGLLNFLEKESFSDEALKKADAWLYNERFVQAVSPYFAHSFTAVTGRLLREGAFDELYKLLNYQGYILPEHSHEAYGKIRTYFDDLSYVLRNLSWEKFSADESVLHFVFSDAWKHFVNKLPSSFATQRDEVVEHFINIVLRFQHKATWYYLHQVLVQLKGIETNDFNRSEIIRIDSIIYQNSLNEGGRTKRGSRTREVTGRAVWWGIWILLMIVRAATCNSNSTNSNDNRALVYNGELEKLREASMLERKTEQRNENVLLTFLDSLSQQKDLTFKALPAPIKTGGQPFSSFADSPENDGSVAITIANRTAHDCVLLYFDGPAKAEGIHRGSLSHTVSVFIKKGEAYLLKTEPGAGSLHFLFGNRWSLLKKEAALAVPNYNHYSQNPKIFLYEFFSDAKVSEQTYLRKGIRIENSGDRSTQESRGVYLNRPSTTTNAVTLILQEKNGAFSATANGGLTVREEDSVNR